MAPYEESFDTGYANEQASQKCSFRCSGEVQLLLVCMFASARVVHHKTAGLRFWRNNQWRILQPAILIAIRKKPRRSGQGVWRGVDEISGMRDGRHTIPVKLLSQLRLSFGPPCSSNSSMGLSRYTRNRFRLHVLDSVYCSYGAIQSCRPTI